MEAAFNFLLGDLAGDIHTAQESTEVPGQRYQRNAGRLDRQSVTGQSSSDLALRSNVDDTDYPDQQAGSTAKYQVHQEDPFEPLPFELPLPRENSRDQYRRRDHCRR